MIVSYFGMLRDIAGKKEETWKQPAATVGELLHEVVAQYGPQFGRWVLDKGEQLDLTIILVNGRDARGMQGLATPLAPTDTVTIFPPVGGG